MDLPLDEHAPLRARRAVGDLLAACRVSDDAVLYDARLLTSELVTNAVRHGADQVVLELERRPAGLMVAVRDGSAALPRPRSAGQADEGGRGLAIVEAVSDDWGVDHLPAGGKRVWALLPLPRAATG